MVSGTFSRGTDGDFRYLLVHGDGRAPIRRSARDLVHSFAQPKLALHWTNFGEQEPPRFSRMYRLHPDWRGYTDTIAPPRVSDGARMTHSVTLRGDPPWGYFHRPDVQARLGFLRAEGWESK